MAFTSGLHYGSTINFHNIELQYNGSVQTMKTAVFSWPGAEIDYHGMCMYMKWELFIIILYIHFKLILPYMCTCMYTQYICATVHARTHEYGIKCFKFVFIMPIIFLIIFRYSSNDLLHTYQVSKHYNQCIN